MNNLHVKKGDTVVVLSGKDKGKKGKVLEVSPKEQKVIVEGLNMVTKHVKPRRQGDAGGIVKAEGALYACKVMAVCPKCGKPTRLGRKIKEDGSKARVCKLCGAEY
ncbi:50S ribosomal protein L24 [Angelakisella massiliensis]|uniref:50S ribosomal protein L24 n=1 Tax=Angelakisella massiliensis TaxID=1871018 RepID=UPI0008F94E4A|nr:50S ribosomal protein L24 [Angelakisella massiliensis]